MVASVCLILKKRYPSYNCWLALVSNLLYRRKVMQKTSQLLHSHFDVVLLYKQIGHGFEGEEKAHVLKSGIERRCKIYNFNFFLFVMVSAYTLYDVNNKTFPKRPDDLTNFAKIVKFEKSTNFN